MIEKIPNTLSTPSSRLEALKTHLSDSLNSVREAARIFQIMEEEGDDTSQIPQNMVRMLRQINASVLLPEVMIRLSGRLRQKVAALPIGEQRLFVEPGALVEIATDEGSTLIDPSRLAPEQLDVVFGPGIVRSPDEQRAFKRSGLRRAKEARRVHVEIDPDKQGLTIDGKWVPAERVKEWAEGLGIRVSQSHRSNTSEAFGEIKSFVRWAEDSRCKVNYFTLIARIKNGWEIERALSEPSKPQIPYIKVIEAFGETKSLRHWSQDSRCPVSFTTLASRIKLGWDAERAISTASSWPSKKNPKTGKS